MSSKVYQTGAFYSVKYSIWQQHARLPAGFLSLYFPVLLSTWEQWMLLSEKKKKCCYHAGNKQRDAKD